MALLFAAAVIFLFGFVLLFGAPYLPSKRRQIKIALEMLEAGEGAVLVDLGAGDGSFMKAAAAKGAEVYGYELNPLLCAVAWVRCLPYRRRVHIRLANFWRVPLPPQTTGVYIFLLDRFMRRLDAKLAAEATRLRRPLKLASFTFAISGRQAVRAEEGVFLYEFLPERSRAARSPVWGGKG